MDKIILKDNREYMCRINKEDSSMVYITVEQRDIIFDTQLSKDQIEKIIRAF